MRLSKLVNMQIVRLALLSSLALTMAACDSNDNKKNNNSYSSSSSSSSAQSSSLSSDSSSSSSMSSSSSSTPATNEPSAAAMGKTSFDMHCSSCHGDTPIDLSNGLGQGGATDLTSFISTAMPTTDPTLCEGDCASNVAAYILSWPQSTVQLGKQTYEADCVGCHGATGQGNTPINLGNGLPGDQTDLAVYIHDAMPNGEADQCEDDCATNVAAYIQSWSDENLSFAASKTGFTVHDINNCGVNAQDSVMSTIVFDSESNGITGWSHINADAPYNGLGQDGTSAVYDVPGPVAVDPSCNDQNTQNIILVKKYANWDQQHSNGIEPSIANANKTFADIDSIVIEFKLNSASTVIPTKDAVMQTYGDVLTTSQYDQLDKYMASFAVLVMDANGGDASNLSLQAERYVEINQANMADKWLKIIVPFDEMNLFTTQNYTRTEVSLDAHASTLADRIQIVAETYGTREDINNLGWVIRNFLSESDWNTLAGQPTYEETFKELSLSIKKVEVIWK